MKQHEFSNVVIGVKYESADTIRRSYASEYKLLHALAQNKKEMVHVYLDGVDFDKLMFCIFNN